MENKYWFLDHTADVLFRAEAETLSELFRQAGIATFATMTDLETVDKKETREISVEANTIEYLLFDFLDELLMYKDSELLFFSDFDLKVEQMESGKWKVSGIAKGEITKEGKHDRKLDVKAITLHLFEVKEVKGGWSCQVLLDI